MFTIGGSFRTGESRPSLRFLRLNTADAATHASTDEALIEAVAAGAGPPTFRLYDWDEPAISLGAAQPVAEVDRRACAERGISIVRRASGGTAVLHVAQLGYSFVLPDGHALVAGDITASYERFGHLLLDALARIGVEAELISPGEARSTRPTGILAAACFAGSGPFEPRLQGRKLVGNAQVRRRGVVLHHGLISLHFEPAAFAALLDGSADERRALVPELDKRIGSLSWACRRAIGREEVVDALCAAIEDSGVRRGENAPGGSWGDGFELRPGELTLAERERAAVLRGDKYTRNEWTARR